jgi:hypothetical protein
MDRSLPLKKKMKKIYFFVFGEELNDTSYSKARAVRALSDRIDVATARTSRAARASSTAVQRSRANM